MKQKFTTPPCRLKRESKRDYYVRILSDEIQKRGESIIMLILDNQTGEPMIRQRSIISDEHPGMKKLAQSFHEAFEKLEKKNAGADKN